MLDYVQCFKLFEGRKILVILRKIWKKSICSGIIIPIKLKRCKKSNNDIICDECIVLVNENKQFEVNLNLLQRKPSNQFVHMLPYYQE